MFSLSGQVCPPLFLVLAQVLGTITNPLGQFSSQAATDYAQLRGAPCNVGEVFQIQNARIGGAFECVTEAEALRHPFFDDGGLQFRSGTPGNIWIRRFQHSAEEPIQLEWFEWMGNGVRVDSLFTNLDDDLGESLYIRMPSSVVELDTLMWHDYHELSLSHFQWTESDQAIDVVQAGGYADSVAIIGIKDYEVVRIGGERRNMRFVGLHPANDCEYPLTDRPCFTALSPNSLAPSAGILRALVNLHQSESRGLNAWMNADALNCGGGLFGHTGDDASTSNWTDSVMIGGYWDNCGGRVIGGVKHLHLDSLTVTDPNGVSIGWKGTPYPENNDCGRAVDLSEKSRALFMLRLDSITGALTVRFGGARWFVGAVDRLGSSADDRFLIRMDSLGWTSATSYLPSTQIDAVRADGCQSQGGKADSFQSTGPGRRWIRIEQVNQEFSLDFGFILEATSNSGAFVTSYSDWVLDGLQNGGGANRIARSEVTSGDDNFGHTFRNAGKPVGSRLMMHDSTTVVHGTFADLTVAEANACRAPCPPTKNWIRDVTITGTISEEDLPTDTTHVEGVNFAGAPREVLFVKGVASVPFDNRLIAPPGSTIDGTGALICGGLPQPLPYTYDGIPDACETVEVSASFEVKPGWRLVSVPIRTMNMSAHAVFDNGISDAFGFASIYKKSEVLTLGEGYWLKLGTESTVDLVGRPVEPAQVRLVPGWNLVGVYGDTVEVDEVSSTPADILTSDFFGYDGGYHIADQLNPGAGYWIRSASDGILDLSTNSGKRRKKRSPPDGARLTFFDALEASSDLYLTYSTPLEPYALPPTPPAGAFDVRFHDDTYAAALTGGPLVAKITSLNFPLRLHVRGLREGKLRIRDAFDGSFVNVEVADDDEIVIPNGVRQLVVEKSNNAPQSFDAGTVYPNPTRHRAEVTVAVPGTSTVRIEVFDVLGRLVQTIHNGAVDAGRKTVEINASLLPSGLYFCRIVHGSNTVDRPFIVVN